MTNHLPPVTRLPGLLAWRYSFDVAATQGQTPYFAVFEAEFADAAATTAARASPQGRQVAGDVANYATGGAVVIHYPVRPGTG
ncbi:EthD family reductase [Streptomyces sp. NPDC006173]|uniref:EthD family reductase n=1 Tax=Streptomyces sp. NPDC006173 TaxID=3155349 RepID=UPI0033E990E6